MSEDGLTQKLNSLDAKEESLEKTFKKREHWMSVTQFTQWALALALMAAGAIFTWGGKQTEKDIRVQNIRDDFSKHEIEANKLHQDMASLIRGHSEEIRKTNERIVEFRTQLNAMDQRIDSNAKETDRKLDLVIQIIRGQK